MTNTVHPSAILGPDVVLGNGNIIGPGVVMRGRITLGDDNELGAHTVIERNVRIGNGNRIVGAASIGSLGEMGSKGDSFVEDGAVVIGDRNVIREFATINSPVRRQATTIGNDGYFMARTHIPHDATIGNHVVMATNSLVGGGVVVSDHAYIGLGAITHQWVDVGESAMVGLQAAVLKDVPPFCLVTGIPAKILKLNRVGAERRGIDGAVLDEVEQNLAAIIAGSYDSANPVVRTIRSFVETHPQCLTFAAR